LPNDHESRLYGKFIDYFVLTDQQKNIKDMLLVVLRVGVDVAFFYALITADARGVWITPVYCVSGLIRF
jgi:hypothetical protein